jgi:hypothetical protein
MHLDSFDPFQATAQAHVRYLPVEDLNVNSARGASGHVLKGAVFTAYRPEAVANTLGFISKQQAILKIFEAFNPERLSESVRGATRLRRTAQIKAEFEQITIDDLDSQPELERQLGSTLIARNLQVYRELRDAIKRYQAIESTLLYSGAARGAQNALKVGGDVGRQLFGWYEEHLKENPNVPSGIRAAYLTLQDPDATLTIEEERGFIRGLLAYQRLNSYIDRAVASQGMLSDLAEYDTLAEHDPLRLNPAISDAKRTLAEFFATRTGDITLSDFASVVELGSLVEFRRSLNERTLTAYGSRFKEALEYFSFVSFKDGVRLPDTYGESVPMERLRQHVLGAKIGVAKSQFDEDKKQALLTQKDFRHIMSAQMMSVLCPDASKFVTSWPVGEFREMVRGVICAYRKAQDFDSKLAAYVQGNAPGTAELDRLNVGDSLTSWKPVLLIGHDWIPNESIRERYHDGRGLSFDEIFDRAIDLNPRSPYFLKHKLELQVTTAAGLIAEKHQEVLLNYASKVDKMIPITLYAELIDSAREALRYPLLDAGEWGRLYWLSGKRYITAESLLKLASVASFIRDIPEYTSDSVDHLREIRNRVHGATPFKCVLGKKDGKSVIQIELADENKVRPGIYRDGMKLYHRDQVEAVVSHLDKHYQPLARVGHEWIRKLHSLISPQWQPVRSRFNIEVSDASAQLVRSMSAYAGEMMYVPTQFVKDIDDLFLRVNKKN